MASPMGASFAAYDLVQVETGQTFYTTHATTEEILRANHNLQRLGEALRYYPEGTLSPPSLHGDGY